MSSIAVEKDEKAMKTREMEVTILTACIVVACFLPDRISIPLILLASVVAVVHACLKE